MPLLINNAEIEQVLTMDDCMAALERAFVEEADGAAANRTKADIHVPVEGGQGWYRYCSMEGAIRSLGVAAIRIKSDITVAAMVDGAPRHQKYCVRPGKFCGLILLFSAQSGELLAMLNDGYIQHMRVGATGGLGARDGARADAEILGILGSGGMAETHALAFAAVRRLKEVRVFSPNPENRRSFADRLSDRLGIPVAPVDAPEAAVRGADMVCTCTDSIRPVLPADWLEPGMHITTVTQFEAEAGVTERIDRYIRYRSGIHGNYYTTPPDQRPPFTGGSGDPFWVAFEERLRDRTVPLGEVLTGRAPARQGDQEITFFNSEGTGVQFAATAWLVYERARARGLGRELPLDWFLQDIRN